MTIDDKNNAVDQPAPLRYHDKLALFHDTISTYYSERMVDVYRTVMTNPPTDDDLVPQRYRHKSSTEINEMLIEYTEEDVAELSDKEKRDEVSGDAISVNTSPEKCRASALNTYRTVKRKYPAPIPDEFKANRGPFVIRLNIRPEYGILSKPKKGHINLLLREGVHIEDIWDKNYIPQKFEYDDESSDNNI